MEGRDILIYLAVKYKGNWNRIYKAISEKEKVTEKEVNETVKSVKTNILTIVDEEYPKVLKDGFKPPFVLFYQGNIDLIKDPKKNIAVIGTDKSSEYGNKTTRKIINELPNSLNIVIGSCSTSNSIGFNAQDEALKSQKNTIRILEYGLDRGLGIDPFLIRKSTLAINDNLEISEYPEGTEPENTPDRFRIVSALSENVLVGEAYKNETDIKVCINHALSLGREISCLPYPANINSLNNELIKDGAKLIENAFDLGIEIEEQEEDSPDL